MDINKKPDSNHHNKNQTSNNKNNTNILKSFENLFKSWNPLQQSLKTKKGDLKDMAILAECNNCLDDLIRDMQSRFTNDQIRSFSNSARAYYLKQVESIWFFSPKLFNIDPANIFKKEKVAIAKKCIKLSQLFNTLLKSTQRKTVQRSELYIDHFSLILDKLIKEVK
ncbi:MAG: hypothetical protein HRT47_07470 [Candidatus Caenarcaniphilales bacterium]|nr:hypothetical protein [Candidatus Caenarcaniphilales bacterium]